MLLSPSDGLLPPLFVVGAASFPAAFWFFVPMRRVEAMSVDVSAEQYLAVYGVETSLPH